MDYERDGIVSLWVAKMESESLLESLMECTYTEEGGPSDFAQLCVTGC